MILGEIARRLRLAVRVFLKPDLVAPAPTPDAPSKDILRLLDTDYRKKLERLGARVVIDVCEPESGTKFRLAGPASDQSAFLRIVHRQGAWEPNVSKYIAENLSPGDVFIDIGANLGYFTALAAQRVAPGGCVHAFEASTFTRSFLQQTLRANALDATKVRVHPVAAWHETATLQFRVSRGAPGGNHVVPEGHPAPKHCEEVQAHPVSEYLAKENLDALKLIKIDIEGAEIGALAGLKALVEKHPADIVCEVNKHCLEMFGQSLDTFWDAVDDMGYTVSLLNRDASLSAISSRADFLAQYPDAEGRHLDVVLRAKHRAE